jgi:uncharacterized membrane protein (UPF0127 family)
MTASQRLVTDKGVEIAGDVEVAETAWQRFVGLMGRATLPSGKGLLIRPCNSIHMFFMRFPIDVAFLDREGRVLRVYHGIKPWRVSRIVLGAKAAVELPAGTLAVAGVETGAQLRLV